MPVDRIPIERATAQPADPPQAEEIGGILPPGELFGPLIADPRQPVFSLQYQDSSSEVQDFNAGLASLGQYLPIYASRYAGGQIEFGIQGAVFALFDLNDLDLLNSDFTVGLPVGYRRGDWSYRTMLYHQSSHLGDDLLLDDPDEQAVEVDPDDFSFEAVEALASYRFSRLRLYGGGGYIFHSDPDLEEPYGQFGAEYRIPQSAGELDFLTAADIHTWREHDWEPDVSILIGLARQREQRELRFMLELYDGFSRNGLFYAERLEYIGFGVFYSY